MQFWLVGESVMMIMRRIPVYTVQDRRQAKWWYSVDDTVLTKCMPREVD